MDALDHRLLDEFQRDFPLVPRPFAVLGAALGLTEAEVIGRLVLMGAPEIPKAGEAHAEVMQVAEGWRAVMWPFASREAAETVRNMFASRGIKAEVIEF